MTRMARRGRFTRRTRAEWRARAAFALGAAVLGYVGTAHSLAHVIKRADPVRAHAIAPWDARLTAASAERRLVNDQRPAAQTETARLARLALRQSPTALSAITTLGLQAQARGRSADARRLFAYAETLSRRDLQTQLWAIEDSVARSDIPGVLHHYDLALRTHIRASDLLFPVLTGALAQAEVRDALAATLAKRPGWGEYFINYATFNGADARANLLLLRKLERIGWNVPERARSSVINALIKGGFVDDAWSYYALVKRGVDRRSSRDVNFTAEIDSPSMLDWVVNESGVNGSIQRRAGTGFFVFDAPSSVGGSVLQQMQLLPAGTYRIESHGSGIEQREHSLPYWVLTCGDGREIGRLVIPNSMQGDGRSVGRFVVPTNCPTQILSLTIRPSDEIAGVSGQINWIRLDPIS